jgi:Uma2 family endonuclease
MRPHAPATADAVERLPEDDRFEILRGEPLPVRPMVFGQSAAAGALIAALVRFARDHRLGVAGGGGGFVLGRDPDTLLAPDAAFVCADRLPPCSEWAGFLHLAPDLAAEVIAPDDLASVMVDKTLTYLDAGVRLVWVVDPWQRIVTVYTPDGLARILREDDVLDGRDVLPGLALPVAELFAFA